VNENVSLKRMEGLLLTEGRFGLVCLRYGIENIQERCSQLLSYKCQKEVDGLIGPLPSEVLLAVLVLLALLVSLIFKFWN